MRVQAEFDNFRKRSEASQAQFIHFATAELISQLLPVQDNFKRAASHAPQTQEPSAQNWIIGIKAIEKQLEEALKQNGLEEIEAEAGQNFNPTLHEAISHEPSQQSANTIIAVIETGYKLRDKILRPAKVRVSSGTAKNHT